MVGGAVLNAATFVGGSYLAKALIEREKQDKALKKIPERLCNLERKETEVFGFCRTE